MRVLNDRTLTKCSFGTQLTVRTELSTHTCDDSGAKNVVKTAQINTQSYVHPPTLRRNCHVGNKLMCTVLICSRFTSRTLFKDDDLQCSISLGDIINYHIGSGRLPEISVGLLSGEDVRYFSCFQRRKRLSQSGIDLIRPSTDSIPEQKSNIANGGRISYP